MITKECRRCRKIKYADYFSKQNGKSDGLRSWCKACHREYAEQYNGPEKRSKWRKKSRTLSAKFSATKRSAKVRGIGFELTNEQYEILIKGGLCHYCTSKLPETRGGLDRKDTKGPYSFSNCVPCCVACNRIKGCALSYEEMIAVAGLLKEMRK